MGNLKRKDSWPARPEVPQLHYPTGTPTAMVQDLALGNKRIDEIDD